jgi:hypothetical protein
VLVTLHGNVIMTLSLWIAYSLLESVYLVADLVPVYLLWYDGSSCVVVVLGLYFPLFGRVQ